MPALLKCENCQGKVSSEAAKKVDGKVVCPRCMSALRKAAEIRKLAEKKVREQRAKAAVSERTAAASAVSSATPPPASSPAKSGSSPRLAGASRVAGKSKSSSRVRAAARAAELLGADPEAAALVRSGRFISVFARIQAVFVFLAAAGALAGGTAAAVLAGRAEGGSVLAMVLGISGSVLTAAILGLAGVAFWRAGSWIARAGALLARLAEAAEQDDPALSPAAAVAQPRIIMPGATRGN